MKGHTWLFARTQCLSISMLPQESLPNVPSGSASAGPRVEGPPEPDLSLLLQILSYCPRLKSCTLWCVELAIVPLDGQRAPSTLEALTISGEEAQVEMDISSFLAPFSGIRELSFDTFNLDGMLERYPNATLSQFPQLSKLALRNLDASPKLDIFIANADSNFPCLEELEISYVGHDDVYGVQDLLTAMGDQVVTLHLGLDCRSLTPESCECLDRTPGSVHTPNHRLLCTLVDDFHFGPCTQLQSLFLHIRCYEYGPDIWKAVDNFFESILSESALPQLEYITFIYDEDELGREGLNPNDEEMEILESTLLEIPKLKELAFKTWCLGDDFRLRDKLALSACFPTLAQRKMLFPPFDRNTASVSTSPSPSL